MTRRGAATGTFDGVHRGHKSVLNTLTRLCEEKGLEPVAITFDRHPLQLIDPKRTPPAITSPETKTGLLLESGVNPVVLKFDDELRGMTAEDWMKKIHEELGVDLLVIGYDNTFGSDGVSMSIADYKELGRKMGIEIFEAPEIEGISSSAIRKAILRGDIGSATSMMGREPSLTGKVVAGNQLGRTIGYPTANLDVEPGYAVPGNGVYAAEAILSDGKSLPAMVNIGKRPTVSKETEPTIEAHIIGWQGDLYDKELTLRFIEKLRDEKKFDSIAALKKQLDQDRDATMKLALVTKK